jgi:GntR family transcriptional regulator
MLNLGVDRSEPMPLHDQVAAEVRWAIANGEADPGERWPLAKAIRIIEGLP